MLKHALRPTHILGRLFQSLYMYWQFLILHMFHASKLPLTFYKKKQTFICFSNLKIKKKPFYQHIKLYIFEAEVLPVSWILSTLNFQFF